MKKVARTNQTALRLDRAQLSMNNALNDAEVLALLSGHGYTTLKLNAGLDLWRTAAQKVNDGKTKAGAYHGSTQDVREARVALHRGYQKLAKISRVLFRGDVDALTRLGLTGRTPKGEAAFLAAASKLLNTSDYTAAMRAKLLECGYTDAKLSTERGRMDALNYASQYQVRCKGAAQQATAEKIEALKALTKWEGNFRNVSRVALEDKPQMCEKLAILARSQRTDAQRAGILKAAATRRKRATAVPIAA